MLNVLKLDSTADAVRQVLLYWEERRDAGKKDYSRHLQTDTNKVSREFLKVYLINTTADEHEGLFLASISAKRTKLRVLF